MKKNIGNKWINKGLIIYRNKLRLLYNIKRNTNLSIGARKYIHTYQQVFRKVVIEAKKRGRHYILSSRNKNKALRKLIKREPGKSQQTFNIGINIGNKTITVPQLVADRFNTFFSKSN